MRVLFVANDPPGHAVYRYRCEHIAEVLRARGQGADVVYVGQARVTVDHDVVVLHRICANAEGKRFAAAARACGAALVYSTDDLIFDEGAFFGDALIPRRWVDFAPLHRRMLCAADAVIVTNELLLLAAKTVSANKPMYSIGNFLSPEMLRLSAAAREAARTRTSGRVTLGYLSGSATHDGDLAEIAYALQEALGRWPQLDLALVGPVRVPPELTAFEGTRRLKRLPFVNWRALPSLLATIDINLVPLQIRPLNACKSAIKALEAAAVGVPTMATPIGEYAVLHGMKLLPLLCPVSWRAGMESLLEDEARRSLGKAAQEALDGFGTYKQWEEPTERIFAEIAALPRPRPASPSPQIVDQSLSPKYLAKAALKWIKR